MPGKSCRLSASNSSGTPASMVAACRADQRAISGNQRRDAEGRPGLIELARLRSLSQMNPLSVEINGVGCSPPNGADQAAGMQLSPMKWRSACAVSGCWRIDQHDDVLRRFQIRVVAHWRCGAVPLRPSSPRSRCAFARPPRPVHGALRRGGPPVACGVSMGAVRIGDERQRDVLHQRC